MRFEKNLSVNKEVKFLGRVEAAGSKNSMKFHNDKSLYLLNERGLFELKLNKELEATPVKGYNESAYPRNVHWHKNNKLLVIRG